MSTKKRTHDRENTEEVYMFKGWRLRFLRLLALLVIACVGLTACGKKQNITTDEPFVVKIGILLDFSGDKKEESEQLYQAAGIAIDEINAAGGVLTDGYRVELVKKDDAGDYMNSVAGYYQLVQDGVCAVIGTNNSKGMEELIHASASANVPIITPSITDDMLVSAENFVYQSCFSDKYMTQALSKMLDTEQKKTGVSQTLALVRPAENERYSSLYEDMAMAAVSYNLGTVYAKKLSEYTDDKLDKLFEEIAATGALNVFIPVSAEELDMVLSAAAECGYKGAFLGLPEWYGYNGSTYGYDIYIPVNMAADRNDEVIGEFSAKLGNIITDGVRPVYDAVYFIRDAIETGYLATATSIALKLPFLTGSTVFGDYSISSYGNTEKTVDIVLMRDGGSKYITTVFE